MNMTLRRGWFVLGLTATLALAACGSDDSSSSDVGPAASTSATTGPATAEPAATGPTSLDRTPELDAIGVIGHSGATGYNSDGQDHDVPANSWVTGTNPEVDSVYLRLLADHPALEGHNWNQAVSGSSVTSLMDQAQALLTYDDPVPDIVFIVSIDNDIRCDGSDEDNLGPFEASMADVVTYLQESAPGIKVFFNDQAVSVQDYDATLLTMDGGAEHLDTPGPCNVMKDDAIDPAGETYLQQDVDAYFARLVHLCAGVTDCATDEGALQTMKISKQDVAPDMDHFSVSGLAKTAAIVWEKLPADWK
jgi:hypothetical protein